MVPAPAAHAPRPHSSGFVDASDGVKLYHEIYHPAGGLGAARGAVFLVHGYADHHGRYGYVRDHLLAGGWAVALLDYRGHGQSGGKRGHVYAFEEYHRDLAATYEVVRAKVGDKPLFVSAHSHGALILLHWALGQGGKLPGTRGAILSCPFLALGFKPPVWKTFLGRAVSRLVPTFSMPNGLDPRDFSHDPVVIAAHHDDHLVVRKATARWFTECSRAQGESIARAGEIIFPYLMIVAGADRVVDPIAARRFHAATGSSDKTLVDYPSLFHEPHNESPADRARLFAELDRWLDARLGS